MTHITDVIPLCTITSTHITLHFPPGHHTKSHARIDFLLKHTHTRHNVRSCVRTYVTRSFDVRMFALATAGDISSITIIYASVFASASVRTTFCVQNVPAHPNAYAH